MGFLGIYRALYDYTPQGEGELPIIEGDILYVLEKSGEDDWWRAKKKASGDDDDEPVGLIPSNYIEEVRPMLTHQLQHTSEMFQEYQDTREFLTGSTIGTAPIPSSYMKGYYQGIAIA